LVATLTVPEPVSILKTTDEISILRATPAPALVSVTPNLTSLGEASFKMATLPLISGEAGAAAQPVPGRREANTNKAAATPLSRRRFPEFIQNEDGGFFLGPAMVAA
jgi:hypothetical protein